MIHKMDHVIPKAILDPQDPYFKRVYLPKYIINEAQKKFQEAPKTVWQFYNSLTYAISHSLKQDTSNSRFDYLKQAWEVSVAQMQ